MKQKLENALRSALDCYFLNPEDEVHKQTLTEISFIIYKDAVTKCGVEPDKFMDHIDAIVKSAVKSLQIHSSLGEKLDELSRQLSFSDFPEEVNAFHVLTLVYNKYLKLNYSNAKEAEVREQLSKIERVINQLRRDAYQSADELANAYTKLKVQVDAHFTLPLEQQRSHYKTFQDELEAVCQQHKASIENSVLAKTVFFNFLACVAGLAVFYGLYLAATSKSRGSFFIQCREAQGAVSSVQALNHLTETASKP
jgi:SOS response regulatory protein OraA/RecX